MPKPSPCWAEAVGGGRYACPGSNRNKSWSEMTHELKSFVRWRGSRVARRYVLVVSKGRLPRSLFCGQLGARSDGFSISPGGELSSAMIRIATFATLSSVVGQDRPFFSYGPQRVSACKAAGYRLPTTRKLAFLCTASTRVREISVNRFRNKPLRDQYAAMVEAYPELAGTPDNPDPAYIKCFEADHTPAQVIASVFGAQQLTS